MAGRGKRRPIHKTIKINKKNKRNTKKDSEVSIWSRRRSKELRNPLFVEGGVLADWSPSHSGRSGNVKWNPKKGSKPGNSNKGKAGSGSKNAPRKSSGNAFGCHYPCFDPQWLWSRVSMMCFAEIHLNFYLLEWSLRKLSPFNKKEGTSRYMDEVQPIVLVDSKETQIVAYFDETPTLKACNQNLTYEYSSDFLLGDSSHSGLGFGEKFEATPGAQSSSKQMEEEEQKGSSFGSSSSEKEMNSDYTANCKAGEEMLTAAFSPKKNSAFLSIGGVKLFTQDITDGGSDWESLDESSESQRVELSQSDDSDDTSNSELDVDDRVAEDYLEGIGGSSNILDDKWLVEYVLDDSDEDSSSSGRFDETLENLGGIALQEASRRYGMKKPQSKKNHALSARDVSQDFDDFMHLKHVAHLPRSWPSKARRSKNFRSFPGDKKKHGKEMIAIKRHQRMLSRRVDLEKINKLIGAGDEDADFAVNEGSKTKSVSADRNRKMKSTRSCSGRTGLYANQPVSFVSSGVVQSGVVETITLGAQEINETGENKDATSSSKFGAFEVHTKGFGSKMMGKMGFVQGGGLGKDGQGMAQPIEVIQRPKSLGLGVDFSNISGDSVKNKPQSIGTGTGKSRKHSKTQSFGAFEKHTKGFGSKMMARMGFVEGMGLGIDSQGIANPLVAVRRPKAWGLGAKG